MAVTSHAYTKLANSLATKKVDLTADTIKVMLLSAYTVGSTQDTAQYLSDVLAVATEASGTGYTAGGTTVPGTALSASGHVVSLTSSGASITWSASTISAAYAVFYDSTPGTNSTNPVLGYWDLGGTLSSSNGNFTLTLASGNTVLTVTGA